MLKAKADQEQHARDARRQRGRGARVVLVVVEPARAVVPQRLQAPDEAPLWGGGRGGRRRRPLPLQLPPVQAPLDSELDALLGPRGRGVLVVGPGLRAVRPPARRPGLRDRERDCSVRA